MHHNLNRYILLLLLLLPTHFVACNRESSPDAALVKGNRSAKEALVPGQMRDIHRAETAYKGETGRYATLAELVDKGLLNRDPSANLGYKFTINAEADRYQCVATPQTYGPNGRLSYFIDDTGILRAGDHQGAAASAADAKVN